MRLRDGSVKGDIEHKALHYWSIFAPKFTILP